MLRRFATALVCALLTVTTPFASNSHDASAGTGKPPDAAGDAAGSETASSTDSAPETRAARNERIVQQSLTARLVATLGTSVAVGIGEAIDAELGGDLQSATVRPLSREAMCYLMREVAIENELPGPLFTRLIWQESKFKPNAVSHVGAQGIAQFMPATAAERGLEDPFDPIQALPASGAFLRDLALQFGNFGLAAAAYNGGPGRVGKWLKGQGGLPKETRNYVIQITGRTAEHWKEVAGAEPHPEALDVSDCEVKPLRTALAEIREEERLRKNGYPSVEIANAAQNRKEDGTPNPPKGQSLPWVAVLAGNWSEQKARAVYADLKKKHPKVLAHRTPTVRVTKTAGKKAKPKTTVGVAAETRAEAQQLCQRMKAAGSSCVVKKEPAA